MSKRDEVLSQGDAYEEAPIEDFTGGSRKKSVQIDGKVKKYIIIGAVLIIISVIGVIVFSSTSKPKSNSAAIDEIVGESEEVGTSDPNYDPFGDVGGDGSDWVDPFADELLYSYSEEQVKELVRRGMSPDEIEHYQLESTPYEDVLANITKMQEEYLRELYFELKEEALTNEGYADLAAETWIGQDPFEVVINNNEYQSHKTRTENVDFIKIPPHGAQLFIKVTLDNGTNVFMNIAPERWITLGDSGNIVLRVTSVIYEGVEIVTNLQEVLV